MRKTTLRLSATGLIVSVLTLVATVPVSAHVVVKPAEVLTAGFQTFTVSVPNEKDQPNTAVKLVIPAGLEHTTPTVKPGWEITVEKEGEGEKAVVKTITWSGNNIATGFRDDFTFSAKVPAEPVELQWKAHQVYADGQVVAWDIASDQQPKKADGSPDFSKSGPFSVTKVVAETEQTTATKKAEQTAAESKKAASRAMNVAVAGVVLALAGVGLSTRKKN